MTAALVIPATLTLPVAGSLAGSPDPVRADMVTISLDGVAAGALASTPAASTPVPVAGEDHAHERPLAGPRSTPSLRAAAAIPPTQTESFGLVGITAAEAFDPDTRVVMRVRQDGQWLPWMEVPVSDHLPDPDTEEGQRARYATEPVVTDGADGIQVRVEGPVAPVSEAEADAYFASRPRQSQLGAWASIQSETLDSREAFDTRVAEVEARFAGGEVPRPDGWSGYRVAPDAIEFWYGAQFRLHERWCYEVDHDGQWSKRLLFP